MFAFYYKTNVIVGFVSSKYIKLTLLICTLKWFMPAWFLYMEINFCMLNFNAISFTNSRFD